MRNIVFLFSFADAGKILSDINSTVNKIVWGEPFLLLLVGVGVFLSVRLRFFQAVRFPYWMRNTFLAIFKTPSVRSKDKKSRTISQFQALSTSLAATVGTGNITGVAAAITVGGAGAVFWMWVAAFFGMITKFSENVLGIYYRRKNSDGEWSGGAMYYLKYGLEKKRFFKYLAKPLSIAFSLFCVLASFGIGNMLQCNNITSTAVSAFSLSGINVFGVYLSPEFILGILLAVLVAIPILGGVKKVGAVAEKIVPFMAVFYILGCLYIFITHISSAGSVFRLIFQGAFGFDSVCGGSIGILISRTVTTGIKRGVFSNEAGLASSVSVNVSSDVKEPVKQGMWGIFEVFFDTFIICTLTAFVILSSGLVDFSTGLMASSLEGTALVTEAFASSMGNAAGIFVAIATLFFAFSTILGWSQYGVKATEYLFGLGSVKFYKIVFIFFIIIGSTMNLSLAWDISDTFNGLMALPNLIGLLILSKTVVSVTDNYRKRKFLNDKNEVPDVSAFEDIESEMAAAIMAEEAFAKNGEDSGAENVKRRKRGKERAKGDKER